MTNITKKDQNKERMKTIKEKGERDARGMSTSLETDMSEVMKKRRCSH
jgi:hypothetical protein